MRRVPVVVAAVGVMLLLPAVASAEDWKPVPDKDVAPSSLGPVCNYHRGFASTDAINVTIVTNEREASTTTGPDGVKTTESRSQLILTFSHVDKNGIVLNSVPNKDVSGPTTVTSTPPHFGRFEGDGDNWLAFGPLGRMNTGEPGLVFTTGHVVVESTGNVATSFSLSKGGKQEDGCRLLAAPGT